MSTTAKTQACRYLFGPTGRCNHGDECKFSHDRVAMGNAVCHGHIKDGKCPIGPRCPMKHPKAHVMADNGAVYTAVSTASAASATSTRPSASAATITPSHTPKAAHQPKTPCQGHFRDGHCKFGDKCFRSHNLADALRMECPTPEACPFGFNCPMRCPSSATHTAAPQCAAASATAAAKPDTRQACMWHFKDGNCTHKACHYSHYCGHAKRLVCKAFADSGVCFIGTNCPMKHDASSVGATRPSAANPLSRINQACRLHFGKERFCRFGANCRYSHDATVMAVTDCRAFLTGECNHAKAGGTCPMRHDESLRKRTPCWYYCFKGECQYGAKCHRNHNDEELRVMVPNAPRFGGSGSGASHNAHHQCGDDVENSCSICLEPMDPSGVAEDRCITTPCNHEFHAQCMESWVNRFLTCPLCRHELTNADCNRLGI